MDTIRANEGVFDAQMQANLIAKSWN